jgi:dTDP-4-amino-4,6-dideoxy-D-glucose transaminase
MVSSAKTGTSDLALFGGQSLFNSPIYVGRPNQVNSKKLLRRITSALDRNWLTNDGPMVRRLEITLAQFLGVNYCVAVSSATMGLQLVAKALGLKGDVLLPSFTFIGTANALAWVGLRPVLCDVDPATHNISVAEVRRRLTGSTSAILGVHLWGRPCDVQELEEVAQMAGVPVFFDAAHAIGCSYRGQPIARWGKAAVFSLHATKCVNSLEGGVIATNDPALANKLRPLRNFGFVDEDLVNTLGINAKMNEFSAAMGLTSLESFPTVQSHNRKIHEAYQQTFAGLDKARVLGCNDDEAWNYHYAILELRDHDAQWRDTLKQALTAENVFARRYFSPGIHRSIPYSQSPSHSAEALPVTERLADSLLALPTGTQLTMADAARIADLIRFCFDHRQEIEKRMHTVSKRTQIDDAEIENVGRPRHPISANKHLKTELIGKNFAQKQKAGCLQSLDKEERPPSALK